MLMYVAFGPLIVAHPAATQGDWIWLPYGASASASSLHEVMI